MDWHKKKIACEIIDMQVFSLCTSSQGKTEMSAGFQYFPSFYNSDAVSPLGTLLVDGSLHTPPLTEHTPAFMPELVLINYQESAYPAATGERRKKT